MASIFGGAGVHLGDRLMGPAKGNRRGHFEDAEFQEFHERILGRIGKTFLTATPADLVALTVDEVEEARALVARPRGHRQWGWKDPRTCLFLELWHALLERPRYIFVYRHPLEVVLSLLRRGADVDVEALENPAVVLEAWRIHNQAILGFYRRHPELCVLAHIRTLTANLEPGILACGKKLGLSLDGVRIHRLYHAEELSAIDVPQEALETLTRLAPEVAELYGQLQQTADLPCAAAERAPASRRELHETADTVAKTAASVERIGPADNIAPARELLGCLASLDLDTVLSVKESLDSIRREQIGALEAERQGLLAWNDDLRARHEKLQMSSDCLRREAVEAEARAARQEARSAALTEALTAVQAQHELVQAQHARVQRRVTELLTRNAQLLGTIEMAERRRAELEASRAALAQERDDKDRMLATIVQTRAWRAAQKWYAVKRMASRLFAPARAVPADRSGALPARSAGTASAEMSRSEPKPIQPVNENERAGS